MVFFDNTSSNQMWLILHNWIFFDKKFNAPLWFEYIITTGSYDIEV